ncbi:MAG TPA: winged helix-turn-helix domain-containing protein [Candidatus Acidoferrum sp.]
MSPEIKERRICRFGLYEVDLDAGILKRHGIPLKLQDQPFRILSILLQHPGEIISREELRNRLWPDGTFVEFDGSLNTALMKLRAALNDDPENPRFVETVPKKGYRFIAPVQVVRGSGEPSESDVVAKADAGGSLDTTGIEYPLPGHPPHEIAQHPSIPEAGTISKRLRSPVASLALFLAGAAVTLGVVWHYWPVRQARVVKVTQLTHTGRLAPNSRVVTDGARIYFVSREGGQWTLMTNSIHGGSVERLSSPFDDTTIFDLSPDRTQLLIGPFTHEGESIPLWIWPAHGGVPHRLGDVTASAAAWSPNGKLIAYTQGNRLLTIGGDGSNNKELQKFLGYPHSLVWSGDGAKIRFTVTDLNNATDDMWEIESDGKGLRRVLPPSARDMHDATETWSGDDRYFLFTRGSDSHISQVVDSVSNVWSLREPRHFFSRAARPIAITQGPVAFRNLAGSSDSNRFFALGTHPEYQLIHENPVDTKHDVILADAGATDVDVTPDGEWLVYSLRENGALWKSRRDGKEKLELTPLPPGALAPQWSPDAKEVLFTAFLLQKNPELYVVPSAGGTPHPVLPRGTTGSTQSGDWSPDGKQILFDYSEQDGSDLRILDRASSKIEKLPGSNGFSQARWSPDGKNIAAIDSRTRQIVLYSAEKKSWSVLAEANTPRGMRWSADGKFIYYQEMGDPEQAVYRIRLTRPAREKVLGFGAMLGSQCHFTGVAPDGSIYATLDRGGTDLYALDLELP